MKPKPNQTASDNTGITAEIDDPESGAENKWSDGSGDSPIAHTVQFPVVCIGLSAGGIAPLQMLFRALNPNTGMAFVVIHHLRQEHPTLLPVILSSCTSMPVQLAKPYIAIQPNHVYVIPSGKEIILTDGAFAVHARSKLRGWANVVSVFLNSLTESRHGGIAVILSGMDADGAQALKAFKQRGGIVIAQEPDTASSREMPSAAIKTGVVDYILEPEAIAGQLERIAGEPKSS
ncbi:MAG TPA: chemotaxis protein CheB [Bryobacteraceae bacterium]|jgi:chemotaxis response regulator CheB